MPDLGVPREHVSDFMHVDEERHLEDNGQNDTQSLQYFCIVPGKASTVRANHVADQRAARFLEASAKHEQDGADHGTDARDSLVFHA